MPDSAAASARRLLVWSAALLGLSFAVWYDWLYGIDEAASQWMAIWRGEISEPLMAAAAFFGTVLWAVIVLAAVVLARRRLGLDASALAWLAASFLLGELVKDALRLAVAQWRPDAHAIPPWPDVVARVEAAGFPSGHAYRSAFVFGWLARRWRGWPAGAAARAGFAAMIPLVGVTRLYFNRHWASDVLGGWLLGLLAVELAEWRRKPA